MIVNGMWNVVFCVQCMKRISMKFVYYYLIAIKICVLRPRQFLFHKPDLYFFLFTMFRTENNILPPEGNSNDQEGIQLRLITHWRVSKRGTPIKRKFCSLGSTVRAAFLG